MKRSILIIFVVLMALVISNTQPAWATIITVEVEGVVDYFNTEGGFALDGSIDIGSAMTGTTTYDTETPDLSGGGNGAYALIAISTTMGNYTFTHDLASPDPPLFNVYPVDHIYTVDSAAARFDGTIYVDGSPKTYDDIIWGWTPLQLFNLGTSSDEYITTDALPDLDTWPELAVFGWRRFNAGFHGQQGDDSFVISGEITSLTLAVPEPATVLLLGLGGLALLRKRRA